jgi:hypothetical protein
LHSFGELFYEQCALLIDRNQTDKSEFEDLSKQDVELIREVLDHAYFCNETVEKFRGRVDILDRVRSYILSGNKEPLVVYGGSGCGKTAIMAKVTSQVCVVIYSIGDGLFTGQFLPR